MEQHPGRGPGTAIATTQHSAWVMQEGRNLRLPLVPGAVPPSDRDLIDAAPLPDTSPSQSYFNLIATVSTFCNLRCPYCFQNQASVGQKRGALPGGL